MRKILVVGAGQSGLQLALGLQSHGYEVTLIDVPFAHIWRNRLLPEVGKRRDFGCLAKGAVRLLTRTERIRFYRTYEQLGKLTPDDKRFLRSLT